MFDNLSKSHAKSVWLFGHGEKSEATLGIVGEKTNAIHLQALCKAAGYPYLGMSDIYQLMGDRLNPLAHMNYELADAGFSIVEDVNLADVQVKLNDTAFFLSDSIWMLSWGWNLAAFLALGLQRIKPLVAKIYLFHAMEKILAPLYEPADVLILESPLAYKQGIKYGLPPWKMIYLPHHFPQECEMQAKDRTWIEELAHNEGKSLSKKTIIVGMVSRFSYGKNCEFALDVMKKIALSQEKVLFVLKGNFPPHSPYPLYQTWLKAKLDGLQAEPWFLWDQTCTPFPDVLKLYAGFDICLHLSGAESASNTVVEYMGLGKPVVLLDGSTNPCLFSQGACFVKTEAKLRHALLPFLVPDMHDLETKLLSLIRDAKLCSNLANHAKKIGDARFHPERSLKRFSLIMEAIGDKSSVMQTHLQHVAESDLKLYQT